MGVVCPTTTLDDVETITIWLWPAPGQERVIGVLRKKEFHKEPLPTVASLMDGISKKYPLEQKTFSTRENARAVGPAFPLHSAIAWLFDSKNRILSEATAKLKSGTDEFYAPNNVDVVPDSVAPGSGTSLRVVLASVDNNTKVDIASSLMVGLFNGDLLLKSIDQSKATFGAFKAQDRARELEKAAKSPSQTKF